MLLPTITAMRHILQQTPSLFDRAAPSPVPAPPFKEVNSTEKCAREFVRWCFSFGPNFRNSPDVSNLRFWAYKVKIRLKQREEAEVLEVARVLFFKRLDQLTKKAEATAEAAN